MRKHKTITISLPNELVNYLDHRIQELNSNTFEETNRSKYIRLLIRKDMSVTKAKLVTKSNSGLNKQESQQTAYYDELLQLGGYKR